MDDYDFCIGSYKKKSHTCGARAACAMCVHKLRPQRARRAMGEGFKNGGASKLPESFIFFGKIARELHFFRGERGFKKLLASVVFRAGQFDFGG